MSDNGPKSLPAIGFLTVCDYAEAGICGGYLILNAGGRPLEFHCTAPVKANRAQEILYGPTLKPFLYGEQIGQTLIGRAKVGPLVVVTDVDPQGPAAEKGLQAGDVIVEVDQQTVASPGDVAARVDEAKANGYRVVTLLVYRGGDYQWVAIRIDRS